MSLPHLSSPTFTIERFPNGDCSLLDPLIGETMHSQVGPWKEAHSIYIDQSFLLNQLFLPTSQPLVIFDIGLGIAANALAAIKTFLKAQPKRDLYLISFETEPSGLEFALSLKENFSFLDGFEIPLKNLLLHKSLVIPSQNSSRIHWILEIGDFRKNISKYKNPNLVFYDLYSPKICPELWSFSCFNELYQLTITTLEDFSKKSCQILTYSSATSVRTALLLAGFYVGHGISTSAKLETTVASTQFEDIQKPLSLGWLEHWKRSSKPNPIDIRECDLQETHHFKRLSKCNSF